MGPLAGQDVVHGQAQAEHPAGHRVALERSEPETERLHEPGRFFHEALTLDDALARDAELALTQVAEAAVDKLRRAGFLDVPEAKVLRLDEQGA